MYHKQTPTALEVVLHSIEIACQICQLITEQDKPENIFLVCGIRHRAQVAAFVKNPAFMYRTLIRILERVNKDLKRNLKQNFEELKPLTTFKFQETPSPPKTPQAFAEWMELNPSLFPNKRPLRSWD